MGNPWFGTWGGGVSKFDGTAWTTYTTDDGLADNWVNAIAVDGAGNPWFGTWGGGVSKFDGTTWTTYTTTDGLVSNDVTASTVDGAGNIWFGTGGGVSEYTPPSFPQIVVNHGTAAPGSYINVTGNHYPSGQNAVLTINGHSLGSVAIDGSGSFTVTLSTDGADEGLYFVTATTGSLQMEHASAASGDTIQFWLDSAEPVYPRDGNYPVQDVPAGIAYTKFIYLPLVLK